METGKILNNDPKINKVLNILTKKNKKIIN
jgi:hypothetical protein